MWVPRRTKSAPTPCGPPSLCAERLTRSACQAFTSIGACAANWTASTWNFAACPRTISPISAIGWIVPTSLLAAITLTSVVRSVRASATASGSTRPDRSTGRIGHVEVAALEHRDAVQDGLVLDGGRDDVAPARALGPGDALDREVVGLRPAPVKTISRGCALMAPAMISRASSTPWRARRPLPCRLDGLPPCSRRYGSMASSTWGRSGLVAAWSR